MRFRCYPRERLVTGIFRPDTDLGRKVGQAEWPTVACRLAGPFFSKHHLSGLWDLIRLEWPQDRRSKVTIPNNLVWSQMVTDLRSHENRHAGTNCPKVKVPKNRRNCPKVKRGNFRGDLRAAGPKVIRVAVVTMPEGRKAKPWKSEESGRSQDGHILVTFWSQAQIG